MAKIVNLQKVAGEQIGFDMGDGRIFLVDDDLPVDSWLTLIHLEQRMFDAAALVDNDEASQEVIEILSDLADEILVILQINHPELERCPFDRNQMVTFMNAVREHWHEKLGPDPTPPSPTPAGTTTPNRAARRKSTRSSGSRASASSTAGRRTTGDA